MEFSPDPVPKLAQTLVYVQENALASQIKKFLSRVTLCLDALGTRLWAKLSQTVSPALTSTPLIGATNLDYFSAILRGDQPKARLRGVRIKPTKILSRPEVLVAHRALVTILAKLSAPRKVENELQK